MTNEYDCDVIVVGGSLVGSSAAMFLAQQGLSVCLVERRTTVSPHPRARGVSVRTMELFRAAGVESDIRRVGEDDFQFVIGETLAGPHQPVARPEAEAMSRLSPTTPYSCDQNKVEPILRRRAEELGAKIWNGSTAAAIEQDSSGVSVLVDRASQASAPPIRVTAKYLVAADGANSSLRNSLGVGRHGRDVPGVGVSVLFDANLDEALRGRHVSALVAPRRGAILFPRGKAREFNWLGLVPKQELEALQRREGGGIDSVAMSAIRSTVGDSNLAVTLRSVLTWKTGAYVADRYRCGRVFFVGDAAHIMPPYGGFGGNTGIADAHNLAWKIAAVCRAAAPDSLLDTYEQERQPIAEFTVSHVMDRGFGFQSTPPTTSPAAEMTPAQISLGYCYPSDVGPKCVVRDPSQATGTPGMRAPHVRLRGSVASTLDLLDPCGFTFLTMDGGPFASALHSRPVPGIRIQAVHRQDIADWAAWRRVFSDPSDPSDPSAGLLVRPDGVVGWRWAGTPPDPSAAVASALERCLCNINYLRLGP